MIDSTLGSRMTTQPEPVSARKFVPAVLPWILAAGFLAVYALTINPWLSLGGYAQQPFSSNSLQEVARTAGLIWQPDVTQPVYWLVTYPFRWVPMSLIPLALNFFSAACAVLTLALLARSVALLPQDRTEEQRAREKSSFSLLSTSTCWLPPLLAVLVCGLQLTFWENATAASGEMLNLLLFAYVIRSLLEYRIDGRQKWLSRAALIFGAAMANNWAMIGFFPLFIIALVWVRGLGFFNLRFLSRMALWGFAGLLFYLLLPFVTAFSSSTDASFWQVLKENLASQKTILFMFLNKQLLFSGDRPMWVLGLGSLLPILVMGIRWPSYFGDPSRLGVTLATLIFHLFHALLFVVCAWFALDPQFSPRNILSGNPVPLLTFYYLGALSIGYFCGYFLLVFGVKPSARSRTALSYFKPVRLAVPGATCAIAVLTPAALVHRNLPQIRTTNGPMLKEYAVASVDALPRKGGIVLSDDSRRLVLIDFELSRRSMSKDFMLLDTGSLESPDNQRHLKTNYKTWPISLPRERKQKLAAIDLINVLTGLSQSNSLYYLHPSFGYYFEAFYMEPHGLVYRLQPFGTNLFAPKLSGEVIAENEKIWKGIQQKALSPLVTAITPENPSQSKGLADTLLQRAHLRTEPNRDGVMLAKFYSRALVNWGARMQQAGQLEAAGVHFSKAIELNSENIVGQVNLECNRRLKSGEKTSVQLSKSIEDQFGKYRTWDQIMTDNGPFDEPTFCFEQGRTFMRGNNYRQAAQQFERVKELAPDHLPARLFLAQFFALIPDPPRALAEVGEIHAHEQQLGLNRSNATELLVVELAAYVRNSDLNGANATLQKALQKYPADEDLLAAASQVFLNLGANSNAVRVLDQQLTIDLKTVRPWPTKASHCSALENSKTRLRL